MELSTTGAYVCIPSAKHNWNKQHGNPHVSLFYSSRYIYMPINFQTNLPFLPKPKPAHIEPTMSPPDNKTTLKTFLTTYSTRLSLSGASKILCLDTSTHEALTQWCKDSLSHIDQPTITLSSHASGSTSQWPHEEASFTHIFATLSPDLKTSVKGLKCVHFSLLWKGVAVVLPPEGGEVAGERVNLARLVELGGFEPGKVRSVDVEGGEVCFAMRWDLLSA
jgi:hypothetical protein